MDKLASSIAASAVISAIVCLFIICAPLLLMIYCVMEDILHVIADILRVGNTSRKAETGDENSFESTLPDMPEPDESMRKRWRSSLLQDGMDDSNSKDANDICDDLKDKEVDTERIW